MTDDQDRKSITSSNKKEERMAETTAQKYNRLLFESTLDPKTGINRNTDNTWQDILTITDFNKKEELKSIYCKSVMNIDYKPRKV
jgi:hypothetical protein